MRGIRLLCADAQLEGLVLCMGLIVEVSCGVLGWCLAFFQLQKTDLAVSVVPGL